MSTDSASHVEQIRRYQPLVRRLAHQMIVKLPANVELDDLIQVGMIGLSDALLRFDANQGVQFETFASQRIRGAMLDELRGNDWMSRGDRRHQRSIEAAVRKLEQRLGRTPSQIEIAREMGLTLTAYQELLGRVRGTQLVHLEDMNGDEGDEDYLDRHVADEQANPVARLQDYRMREALVAAIDQLPEREQYVMNLRYELDMTFKEIGDILGVTESRVWQIHAQGVVRLRKQLGGWGEQSVVPVPLPQSSPVFPGCTFSTPNTKGGNAMTPSVECLSVSVVGNVSDFRPPIPDRVRAMVAAALREAAVEAGAFTFRVERACPELVNQDGPYMDVRPSASVATQIYVRIKAARTPDSALSGVLSIPSEMERRQLLSDLNVGLTNFNSSGWQEVFDEIGPGPAPAKIGADARAPSPASIPVARTSAPPSPSLAPTPAPAPPARPEDALPQRDAKLASALVAVLKDPRVANGVFLSGFFTLQVTAVLPEERTCGWITSIYVDLRRKGWIQATGQSGQYQVTPVFAEKFSPGTVIEPVTVEKRRASAPTKLARSSGEGGDRQASPAAKPGTTGFLVILEETLQEANMQIAAERKRLQDVLSAAQAAQAAKEAELAIKREEVAAAQAALTTFEERVLAMARTFQVGGS